MKKNIAIVLCIIFLVSQTQIPFAFAKTYKNSSGDRIQSFTEPTVNSSGIRTQDGAMISKQYQKIIQTIWANKKQDFAKEMSMRLAAGDIYVLYDMEINTENLIAYAFYTKDINLTSDLATLYLAALSYIRSDAGGSKKWIYSDRKNKELRNYIGEEIPLCSSQFLFAVTELMRYISEVKPIDMTDSMRKLAVLYRPVAIDFYNRYYSEYYDLMQRALAKPFPPLSKKYDPYMPVDDKEMFILGGMANMLAANAKRDDLVPLTSLQADRYKKFIALGCKLLNKRLAKSRIKDFKGRTVQGYNFDLGVWDGYEDNAYSGYFKSAYPKKSDKKTAKNVGWDISHARRFVNIFTTLYDNKTVTGQTFPTLKIMQGLANQLVYGAFNHNMKRPLFSNFMDGTNGWYRVGYAGRKNYGFGPYALSDSIPTGGYGYWSRFNADIQVLFNNLYNIVGKGQIKDVCGKNYGMDYGAVACDTPHKKGLTFNGSSNYIDIKGCDNLKSTKGTLEFWIRSGANGKQGDIINIFRDGYENFLLVRKNDADKIAVIIENKDITKTDIETAKKIKDNKWHQIAITQDGNKLKIYMDGQYAPVTGLNSDAWTNHLDSLDMWIGKGHWSAFKGCLDEIRIYNRALTESEIKRHFNSYYKNDTGLASYWNFDNKIDPKLKSGFIDRYYPGFNHTDSVSMLEFLPTMLTRK